MSEREKERKRVRDIVKEKWRVRDSDEVMK
jgi:hypothetical protein